MPRKVMYGVFTDDEYEGDFDRTPPHLLPGEIYEVTSMDIGTFIKKAAEGIVKFSSELKTKEYKGMLKNLGIELTPNQVQAINGDDRGAANKMVDDIIQNAGMTDCHKVACVRIESERVQDMKEVEFSFKGMVKRNHGELYEIGAANAR